MSRGWDGEKFEDMSEEIHKWNFKYCRSNITAPLRKKNCLVSLIDTELLEKKKQVGESRRWCGHTCYK